ncbi:NACHT domain-containing protein [Nannocystaceae bacterium ST9]
MLTGGNSRGGLILAMALGFGLLTSSVALAQSPEASLENYIQRRIQKAELSALIADMEKDEAWKSLNFQTFVRANPTLLQPMAELGCYGFLNATRTTSNPIHIISRYIPTQLDGYLFEQRNAYPPENRGQFFQLCRESYSEIANSIGKGQAEGISAAEAVADAVSELNLAPAQVLAMLESSEIQMLIFGGLIFTNLNNLTIELQTGAHPSAKTLDALHDSIAGLSPLIDIFYGLNLWSNARFADFLKGYVSSVDVGAVQYAYGLTSAAYQIYMSDQSDLKASASKLLQIATKLGLKFVVIYFSNAASEKLDVKEQVALLYAAAAESALLLLLNDHDDQHKLELECLLIAATTQVAKAAVPPTNQREETGREKSLRAQLLLDVHNTWAGIAATSDQDHFPARFAYKVAPSLIEIIAESQSVPELRRAFRVFAEFIEVDPNLGLDIIRSGAGDKFGERSEFVRHAVASEISARAEWFSEHWYDERISDAKIRTAITGLNKTLDRENPKSTVTPRLKEAVTHLENARTKRESWWQEFIRSLNDFTVTEASMLAGVVGYGLIVLYGLMGIAFWPVRMADRWGLVPPSEGTKWENFKYVVSYMFVLRYLGKLDFVQRKWFEAHREQLAKDLFYGDVFMKSKLLNYVDLHDSAKVEPWVRLVQGAPQANEAKPGLWICGEGGTGKTSFMLKAIHGLAQTHGVLPIVIRPNKVASGGEKLAELLNKGDWETIIADALVNNARRLSNSTIRELGSSGRIVVVLDSLSEFPRDVQPRFTGNDWLRWIVTSRNKPENESRADTIPLERLTGEQVKEFATKQFDGRAAKLGEDVRAQRKAALEKHVEQSDTPLPFYLDAIAVAYSVPDEDEKNRRLESLAYSYVSERFSPSKSLPSQDEAYRVAQKIAYWMMETKGRTAPLSYAEMKEYLHDEEHVSEMLEGLEGNRILTRMGKHYGFVDDPIAELLAVEEVRDRVRRRDLTISNIERLLEHSKPEKGTKASIFYREVDAIRAELDF